MVNLVIYTENYFHGGLEKFIYDLLGSKDINAHILVNSENSRIIEFAQKNKINFTTIDLVNYKIDSVSSIGIFKKVVKIINFLLHNIYMIPNYFKIKNNLKNLNNYENILIVNGGYPAAVSCFSASLAAKNSKFKKISLSILSSPSPNYSNKIYRYFQLKFDLFFDKYIDFYIPNSNAIKSKLIQTVCLEEKKIKTVYTGVEIPTLQNKSNILEYGPNILKRQEGDIWIGMLGLLGSTKRQDLIIDALAELDIQVKLLLVGDGPKMDLLVKKVKDLGLEDRVVFTGWMNETHNVYSFLDIVTFMSDQEGLPYAISEAMSYKVPIISSDVGGINEQIIDMKGGLLVKNDKDDLVEKINYLVSNRILQDKYSTFSYNRVQELFSINSMNQQIQKLFK